MTISVRIDRYIWLLILPIAFMVYAASFSGIPVLEKEHSILGGLGSAVCETLAACYPVPVQRIGIQDQFGQSGTAEELMSHYGLTVDAYRIRHALAHWLQEGALRLMASAAPEPPPAAETSATGT